MPLLVDADSENCSDVSSECSSNKFWTRPLDTSPEPSSKEKTTGYSSTSYEYTIKDLAENDITAENLAILTNTDAKDLSAKRYQTKMLLVSLIESFCRSYGDSPDANRKVFFLICQTLRSLGIIDAEFVDEMTSVRSAFQDAFRKLFFTAVQTVQNQDLMIYSESSRKMITAEKGNSESESEKQDECYFSPVDYSGKNNMTDDRFLSASSTCSSRLQDFVTDSTPSFFQNLSIQNSRYHNDFVELNLLGKGGFASAFRARNKLDGIEYAVKKIRLGKDIEEEGLDESQNPYEKIFREIKSLARLEHHNVIRYYSSWLEFDEGKDAAAIERFSGSSDWGEDDYSDDEPDSSLSSLYSLPRHDESSSGFFHGFEPHFDDDASFGMPISTPGEDSGMSQIQFGDGSSSSYQQDMESNTDSYFDQRFSHSRRSSRPRSSRSSGKKPKSKGGWTLFIQMQLCPTTLHDYIKFRNKRVAEDGNAAAGIDTKRNFEIFSQILEGTAYIHDQGLIHRDLKPSNIFLGMPTSAEGRKRRCSFNGDRLSSGKHFSSGRFGRSFDDVMSSKGLHDYMWEEYWVPKIGDFGLAADVIDEVSGDSLLVPPAMSTTPPTPKLMTRSSVSTLTSVTSDDTSKKGYNSGLKRPKPRRTRTIGVGTRTYASPEQLAIPAQAYDEKVDIYSLGIILFELFQPFSTAMERADALQKLKKGVFPDGFLELYPKVSALIIWMMNEKPEDRPNASHLLNFEFPLPASEDDKNTALQLQLQANRLALQHKNKKIDELTKKVALIEHEKTQAIDEMQRKIDELQRQLDIIQGVGSKVHLLKQSPSFSKKKKEVRWSSVHAPIISKFQ